MRLGKMDFVVKGVMIGGFALVAAPAHYRVTGVKTFIVSHEGIVYQKDLGPDSLNSSKRWSYTTRTGPGFPQMPHGKRTALSAPIHWGEPPGPGGGWLVEPHAYWFIDHNLET
jgi:hypothetical protein